MAAASPGSFKKNDPRINRLGRPRSLDKVRELAQAIANEPTADDSGKVITRIEKMLRQWIAGEDTRLQVAFMEYAYGKVPNNIIASNDGIKVVIVDRVGPAGEAGEAGETADETAS